MNNILKIKYDKTPLVLVVDDLVNNLKIISSILYANGYNVETSSRGDLAIEIIKRSKPDLILLDIMMPDVDGYEVCRAIKRNDETKNIPIVFITALTDKENLLRGFEVGGCDYIPKPFHPQEILARINLHLELKFARELLEDRSREISLNNYRLKRELIIASQFFNSLLPSEMEDDFVKTTFKYVPSEKLGGDAFGYYWLDEDNFVFYLLDVCGHGISSALFSSSVVNNLRFRNLSNTDFYNPASVFQGLNKIYQMNTHHGLYFTIWYAVYNKKTRVVNYASAGHHPAISLSEYNVSDKLSGANFIIGGLDTYNFKYESKTLPPNTEVYIFSDGCFTIKTDDGRNWTIDDLTNFFTENKNDESVLNQLYEYVKYKSDKILKDDFTILKIIFK